MLWWLADAVLAHEWQLLRIEAPALRAGPNRKKSEYSDLARRDESELRGTREGGEREREREREREW